MNEPVKVGFSRVLVAFFCPPLYFLLRRRFIASVVHTCIYLLAIVTLIFGVGVFFWAVGLLHACWDLAHLKQEQTIQRHATVIAEKLAAAKVFSA